MIKNKNIWLFVWLENQLDETEFISRLMEIGDRIRERNII